MKTRDKQDWREMPLGSAIRLVMRGWRQSVHPDGRPYALRSPKGTLFDFRILDHGCLVRPHREFQLKDS